MMTDPAHRTAIEKVIAMCETKTSTDAMTDFALYRDELVEQVGRGCSSVIAACCFETLTAIPDRHVITSSQLADYVSQELGVGDVGDEAYRDIEFGKLMLADDARHYRVVNWDRVHRYLEENVDHNYRVMMIG
jgi:hypothetical protein